MADGEQGDEAAAGATTFVGSEGLDWSCRLKEVQRIEADPEDDDPLENLFAVTLSLDGPNVEGELEVMVPDATDLEVVAVALDTLHDALVAWADLIRRRRDAARTEMPET